MRNLKFQVSKLDPPKELRLYVGAFVNSQRYDYGQSNPTADKHKNHKKKKKKKSYVA